MKSAEIAWLAGLLEGEACFIWMESKGYGYPRIHVEMTDADVMARVHSYLAKGLPRNHLTSYTPKRKDGRNYQKVYRVVIAGRRAAEWMMTLRPLLGERRRAKIDECLAKWKER